MSLSTRLKEHKDFFATLTSIILIAIAAFLTWFVLFVVLGFTTSQGTKHISEVNPEIRAFTASIVKVTPKGIVVRPYNESTFSSDPSLATRTVVLTPTTAITIRGDQKSTTEFSQDEQNYNKIANLANSGDAKALAYVTSHDAPQQYDYTKGNASALAVGDSVVVFTGSDVRNDGSFAATGIRLESLPTVAEAPTPQVVTTSPQKASLFGALISFVDNHTQYAQGAQPSTHQGVLHWNGAWTGDNFWCDTGYTLQGYHYDELDTNNATWYACWGTDGQPDLIGQTGSPVSGNAGSAVTLSGTVTNQGNADTGSGFNNLFQVTESDQATVVDNVVVAAGDLTAGASQSFSQATDYTFPTAGTYYYRICADENASWQGTITESNETNNCGAWSAITIATPYPPAATNLSSTCSTDGTEVTLSWTAAPGATSYYPRVSSTPAPTGCSAFGWSVFTDNQTCYPDPEFPSGLPGTSVVNFPVTPGQTYGWWVHSANAGGINPTPAYGNAFSCTGQPDLTAGDITETSAVAGTPITLSALIKNQGTAATGKAFNVGYAFDNQADHTTWYTRFPWAATSVAALSSGGSEQAPITYTFPSAGTYYVIACADYDNTVVESNENNNCGDWVTVNVLPAVPPTPTGATATCSADGTHVSLSWNAAPGATNYYPRMYVLPVPPPAVPAQYSADCVAGGWQLYSNPPYSGGDNDTCFPNPDAPTATSFSNLPVVTGLAYNWYVYSWNSGGLSASPATGSFTCNGQPDLTAAAATPVSATAGTSYHFTGTAQNLSTTAAATGGFYSNFEVCDPGSAGGTTSGNCSIGGGVEFLDGNTAPPYVTPSDGIWYGATIAPSSSGGLSYDWAPPSVKTWTLEHDLHKDLAKGGIQGIFAYAKDLVKSVFYPDAFAGNGSYTLDYRWCANNNSAWTNILGESNYANDCGGWGTITVTTNPPVIASCSASPNPATTGQTVTWTANGVSGGSPPYTYLWSGNVSGSAQSVTQSYTTAGTYNGTVTVTDKVGATATANCSTPLSVISCIPSLSASPATPPGIILGQTDTLTWSEPGICASSCTFSDGHTAGLSGSYTVTPPDPTPASVDNYSVTCGAPANVNTTSIHVTVPTVSITATPDRVVAGQTSTIAWTSADTSACTITGNGNSWTGLMGSKTSNPITEQEVYSATCSTAGAPVHAKVIVNIVPKYNEF